MKNIDEYKFGGRPVTPINLLLLISEMEGTYQHLKYMGFEEDMNIIDEMKKRYYKLYFKLNKEEKKGFSSVGRAPALQAGSQEFESPNLHAINI